VPHHEGLDAAAGADQLRVVIDHLLDADIVHPIGRFACLGDGCEFPGQPGADTA
jgi:hypothetical protein